MTAHEFDLASPELDEDAPPLFLDLDAITPGTESASRGAVEVRRHVMVDRGTWAHFHARMMEIEREWRGGSPNSFKHPPTLLVRDAEAPGHLEGLAAGLEYAKAELRAEIARLADDFPGGYLVPV